MGALPSPEVVWGLYPRLVGVVFLVSFASLWGQVVPIAGEHGVRPMKLRLGKYAEAFSPWRRWVHFPTLLWLDPSDRMLRGLVIFGGVSALTAIYGGPAGFWGLLGCYVAYVSLDRAMGLAFPWDCVLFELGFLSLFLPEYGALPELRATEAPAPLLVWALRLVVVRVLLGFGKAKFAESSREDWGYLSGFLANQPLPTPIAWYLHKAPLWMLKVAIWVMFLTEVPIPLLIFHPDLGVLAALAIVGLMLAIQACGSFGYFSLVIIVGCVALLDTQTPRQLDLGALFGPDAPNVTNAVVLLHLVGAALAFPVNSWVAQNWHHWVVLLRAPRPLTWPIAFYRLLHPLRWVHPYGIFPPKTQPGVRTVPVIEVSWDGETWKEIEYPIAATRPTSAPRFVAPHHPRGDQSVIYEVFGANAQSLINGLTSPNDPFIFGNYSEAHALLQRILEGRYYPGVFTKPGSFEEGAPPPTWARARTFLMQPTTLEERRRTGAWWRRAYIGPHIPPVRKIDGFWERYLPEPEMWHCEMVVWRRRSVLRSLLRRGEAGESPTAAILADTRGLDEGDVARFWSELLPALREFDREDWSRLQEAVALVRERFGAEQMRRFERVLGRLSVLASGRFDPLYLHRGLSPPLPAPNYARLWMATHDAIWEGEEAFEAVLADPMSLARRLDLSLERGLFLSAVFRYEATVFEAQKLRLFHNFMLSYHRPKPGFWQRWEENLRALGRRVTVFVEVFDAYQDKAIGEAYDEGFPERYPRYERRPDGVVALDPASVEWEPLPPARG